MTDALRGELYAAVYEFRGGMVYTCLAPTVARPDALVEAVRSFDVKALTGTAPEPVLADLAHTLGCTRLTPAGSGAAILLSLLATGGALHSVADPRRWEPDYGRPAEAQRKWEEQHGRPLPPATGHPG